MIKRRSDWAIKREKTLRIEEVKRGLAKEHGQEKTALMNKKKRTSKKRGGEDRLLPLIIHEGGLGGRGVLEKGIRTWSPWGLGEGGKG